MITTTKKLLVVDDDPGILRQVRWSFEGFDVITADNRLHPMEAFKEHHPQVVMLDLGLPPDVEGNTEGFKILTQILEEDPDTRVVIVSGASSMENRIKAVESGAFEFYPKPINVEQLTGILERAYLDATEANSEH